MKVSPRRASLLRSLSVVIAIGFFVSSPQAFAAHEGKLQILLLGDSRTEGSVPRRLQPDGPHLEKVVEQLLAAEGDLSPCHVINSSLSVSV